MTTTTTQQKRRGRDNKWYSCGSGGLPDIVTDRRVSLATRRQRIIEILDTPEGQSISARTIARMTGNGITYVLTVRREHTIAKLRMQCPTCPLNRSSPDSSVSTA